MNNEPKLRAGDTTVVTAKPWWTSKQIWVSVITVIIGLTSFLIGPEVLAAMPDPIEQHWKEAVLMIAGLLGVVLRWLTKQPITSQ